MTTPIGPAGGGGTPLEPSGTQHIVNQLDKLEKMLYQLLERTLTGAYVNPDMKEMEALIKGSPPGTGGLETLIDRSNLSPSLKAALKTNLEDAFNSIEAGSRDGSCRSEAKALSALLSLGNVSSGLTGVSADQTKAWVDAIQVMKQKLEFFQNDKNIPLLWEGQTVLGAFRGVGNTMLATMADVLANAFNKQYPHSPMAKSAEDAAAVLKRDAPNDAHNPTKWDKERYFNSIATNMQSVESTYNKILDAMKA